ncbi:MAG: hypothetical protein HW398_814, partial [Acidobacteria bacterium]|nr:hypothetical protein [Acidobacteriota bacterium]
MPLGPSRRYLLVLLILPLVSLAALPFVYPQTSAPTEMITVPAGRFTMGSDDGPADERPAHPVELAAFAIDRFPVTNAQFAAFLTGVGPVNLSGEKLFDVDDADARIHQRERKWAADKGYENHPVVEVSWVGARDYC